MHTSALVSLLAFAAAASAFPANPNKAHTDPSITNLKEKIKNVVVLVMENRSVDNLLGGQTIKGLENPINHGPYCNYYNVTDHSQGVYCTAAKDYDSILYDPDHGHAGNNMEFFSSWDPDSNGVANGSIVPTMDGFVAAQIHLYPSQTNYTLLAAETMNYYTEDQVPVITALTQNYVVFNNWHSDYPGVSEEQYYHPPRIDCRTDRTPSLLIPTVRSLCLALVMAMATTLVLPTLIMVSLRFLFSSS